MNAGKPKKQNKSKPQGSSAANKAGVNKAGAPQPSQSAGAGAPAKSGKVASAKNATPTTKAAGNAGSAGNSSPNSTTAPAHKVGFMDALRSSATTVNPEERAVTHINPMSALKLGFMVNLCFLVVLLVASLLLYIVLGIAGVWGNLNSLLGDLTGTGSFGILEYLGVVLAFGLVELVVFTLLAPLLAMIYNLSAQIIGGLRVTVDH